MLSRIVKPEDSLGTTISGFPSPSRSPTASTAVEFASAVAQAQTIARSSPSCQTVPPQVAKKSLPLFGPPPWIARTMPFVEKSVLQ